MAARAQAKPAKRVELRGAKGGKTVLELTPGDFAALKAMASGRMEIRHAEKEFRRLHAMGLVKNRFVYPDDGDWPLAVAELTDHGRQALTQEFAA